MLLMQIKHQKWKNRNPFIFIKAKPLLELADCFVICVSYSNSAHEYFLVINTYIYIFYKYFKLHKLFIKIVTEIVIINCNCWDCNCCIQIFIGSLFPNSSNLYIIENIYVNGFVNSQTHNVSLLTMGNAVKNKKTLPISIEEISQLDNFRRIGLKQS